MILTTASLFLGYRSRSAGLTACRAPARAYDERKRPAIWRERSHRRRPVHFLRPQRLGIVRPQKFAHLPAEMTLLHV